MAEFRARSRLFHESGLPVNEDSARGTAGRVVSLPTQHIKQEIATTETEPSIVNLRCGNLEPTVSHMSQIVTAARWRGRFTFNSGHN
jgi:hypothetical protein